MYLLNTYDGSNNLRSLYEGRSNVIRIRVATKWDEFEFGSNNKLRSVDMIVVDDEDYELHVIIPDNLIWKFNNNIQEGGMYFIEGLHLGKSKSRFKPTSGDKRGFFKHSTTITPLGSYDMLKIPRNFNFTDFEQLGLNAQNILLTDVVGYLKTFTKIQLLKNEGGKANKKREIVMENLSGSTLKIALWGAAADQLIENRIHPANILNPNMVAVCSTYVKSYQGNITLSSTNSTRVYYGLDPGYVMQMRRRYLDFSHTRPITTVKGRNIAPSNNTLPRSDGQLTKYSPSGWKPSWKAGLMKSKIYMFHKDMTKNVKIGFFRTVGRELARVIMGSILG